MDTPERVIKPGDDRIKILRKLRNCEGITIVYNLDDPVELAEYSVIHNLMWRIQKDGLIEYSRNLYGVGNFMTACITFQGVEWLRQRRNTMVLIITSVIAAIGAVFTIVQAICNGY